MNRPAYAQPQEDARRHKFLVGWNREYINSNIGGCPYATTLVSDSDHFGWEVLIALACKRWGCPHCGPIRTAQLARNVERAQPTKFITLTTDQTLWESGRAAFDGIRRHLPEFTKVIRKHVGEFEYVRILELHANGMPHWHLLARCKYIPQKVVSEVWAKQTGSPIVDIRKACEGAHAARYVMKYLTKCKYIEWTNRRVSWSRHFFPPQPPTPKDDWKLTNKRYSRDDPSTIMQTEFRFRQAHRCGPYAWVMEPYTRTREEGAASVPS